MRVYQRKATCPHCGAAFDCHTSVRGKENPSPGDVTVCLYCGKVSRWNEELQLRAASPEELAELMGNPQVRRAIWTVQSFQRRN